MECSSKLKCKKCFIGFYLYSKNTNERICKRNPNYEKPVLGDEGWEQRVGNNTEKLQKVEGSDECIII